MGKKPAGNVKIVIFEVVTDPGILKYSIAVNDVLLLFDNNNSAKTTLREGGAFTLQWIAFGEPDSAITIRYIVDGHAHIAVARSKIPPDGRIISFGRFLL